MAEVITHDINSVSMQGLSDGGLNPFAVQLLVESFASPERAEALGGVLKPVTIVWRGVQIVLSVYEFPQPADELRAPSEEMR